MLGVLNFFGIMINKVSKDNQVLELIEQLRPLKVDLIRLGGNGDGGYLLPNDLNGITKCFSPGVSNIINFEIDLLGRGIQCFLADGSVDSLPMIHPDLVFEKKFVGPTQGECVINFQHWIQANSESGEELILQMDIEGSEYSCILSCDAKVLSQFRVIIVEFHFLHKLCDPSVFPVLRDTFLKLLDTHRVVHLHPNNSGGLMKNGKIQIPRTMEFTFIRKDYVKSSIYSDSFPHPLDFKNVHAKREVVLPRVWYS